MHNSKNCITILSSTLQAGNNTANKLPDSLYPTFTADQLYSTMDIVVLLIFAVTMLMFTSTVMAVKHCPDCGHTPVPYPLSTGPDCGDQSYKIRCNEAAGTLWFDAINGSSYMITSINPLAQRLVIRPPGFISHACIAADLHSLGIELDGDLPFNITSSNTVLVMNCTNEVLEKAVYNCSSSSICHKYIGDNAVVKKACGLSTSCCWFKTGGSTNAYRIRVRPERCSAYQSFVNLNSELPVSKWPEPGVELGWGLPQEPICKLQVDCDQDLENSACLQDPYNVGLSRCFCKTGLHWDPINGICQRNISTTGLKCTHKRGCKHRKNKAPLMGGLALAGVATLIGVAVMISLVYKKQQAVKRKGKTSFSLTRGHRKDMLHSNDSGRLSRIFTGREITKATKNFSSDNLLGSGGFGEVFKGVLDDGTITAIKRAKPGNTTGIDQILNEVRILCQVNHRNLVNLLGCCVELEQPLLIYEYIPNGTLFDRLHRIQSGKWSPLTWRQRLYIALQVAEALAYLHSAAMPPIYHSDIKSSNILINEKLDAKVSDFGLSRLAVSNASHVTTSAQGSLGYLDPEYYLNFQLTDKSDVYSFGVVLMELLTSMKAIDLNREQDNVNLVVYIKKVLKEERWTDIIDPALKEEAGKVELESMNKIGTLAAACLDESRRNRPSMKQVATDIERIVSVFPDEV